MNHGNSPHYIALLGILHDMRKTASAVAPQTINVAAYAERIEALYGWEHCTAEAPCGACRKCADWVE